MATTLQNCYLQNGQNVILPKPTMAMQQYTKWWQQMIISQFQNHARKESLQFGNFVITLIGYVSLQ
jgi:hypothetical protein